MSKTIVVRLLGVAALAAGVWTLAQLGLTSASAQDKKPKNPEEGKKGVVVGTLVKKDDKSIEVKADGEEKARRFVPQWKGGAPAQGGGFDKEILKTFAELKVGSRVEVHWVFEERLRALKVIVLRAPKEELGK
jgi:hypothetical protein